MIMMDRLERFESTQDIGVEQLLKEYKLLPGKRPL